eukprot:UN02855
MHLDFLEGHNRSLKLIKIQLMFIEQIVNQTHSLKLEKRIYVPTILNDRQAQSSLQYVSNQFLNKDARTNYVPLNNNGVIGTEIYVPNSLLNNNANTNYSTRPEDFKNINTIEKVEFNNVINTILEKDNNVSPGKIKNFKNIKHNDYDR